MSILRRFSTIKIGGGAEKIIWAHELTENSELPQPIRILGNGSNVLIDDRGLKGTVILTRDETPKEPKILNESATELLIEVSGGTFLPTLSKWASSRGWTGCEFMVGVPGTLGGAVIQNAGATEQEIKDILESVEVFELADRKSKILSAKDCGLRYRASDLFEKNQIVRSAKLKLKKRDQSEIDALVQKNLDYRKTKTPWNKPSLGSMYTRLVNPSGGEKDPWIYPGKLIEDAGLKGHRQGNVMISDVHANYFLNLGNATFEEMLSLMQFAEDTVFKKLGIKLRREIHVWTDRGQVHEPPG